MDVADLRAACLAALDAVRAASPEALCIVGPGPVTETLPPGTQADFRPWGADVQFRLPVAQDGKDDHERELPLSLAVGAWLADQRDWAPRMSAVSVAAEDDPEECERLGADLAISADRVALLVMSDGSARRSDEGPRPYDPRAATYDLAVVDAVRSGEPSALLELDGELAAAVAADGLNPLRTLAGAAGDSGYDTDVLYDAAPYGVGYYVAVWERHG